ncbi:MAG: acyl-CoA dehydrogenase family protein [Acidobacteria bacterium]|nr:acyl-CoA dehydrogenase family protein [Acidobacteriota bacterium]
MATTAVPSAITKGGSFLLDTCRPEDIFTPADLQDDQKLIGQTAEDFVTNEVLPHAHDLEEKKPGLMVSLLKKAGELGLLGPGVPEQYGGAGLDKVAATVLAEKFSGYGSFATSHGAHAGIGTVPLVYFGSEEQKKKYLPRIASGELLTCYCLSEPQAGSDAQNLLTTAVLSPDKKNYILNGQKMWITSGGFADVYIVFAKVDGEKVSCFIVERNFPGFKVGGEEKKMGIKGSSTVPIFFDNCPVPAENLLGEVGAGFKIALNTLNSGRFTLGTYCMGGAKLTLAVAAKYAKERKAFGHSIADFGLIQQKLADMAIQTYAVESMVYRSAGMIDSAMAAAATGGDKIKQAMSVLEEYAIESSITKIYGSEMLDFVVDEAVQIYGGYGYHEEYPVARAYRDSRINRIFEGTNEINRLLIIDMLMKRAMKGILPLIPAAMKIAGDLMSPPSFEEPSTALFAEEDRAVENAKKAFLMAAGSAVQKHQQKLADHQEVIGALSNTVMEIYAMESSLRRAQKCVAARGEESAGAMVDAARAFIYDAMDRVEKQARTAVAAVAEGDMLRIQLAALKRFTKREAVDTIAMRRRVAAAVLAGERYPFEGR